MTVSMPKQWELFTIRLNSRYCFPIVDFRKKKFPPDQKIVGNSFQPIGVIITGNRIHRSFMLTGTEDPIGQLGCDTKQEFSSIL